MTDCRGSINESAVSEIVTQSAPALLSSSRPKAVAVLLLSALTPPRFGGIYEPNRTDTFLSIKDENWIKYGVALAVAYIPIYPYCSKQGKKSEKAK